MGRDKNFRMKKPSWFMRSQAFIRKKVNGVKVLRGNAQPIIATDQYGNKAKLEGCKGRLDATTGDLIITDCEKVTIETNSHKTTTIETEE